MNDIIPLNLKHNNMKVETIKLENQGLEKKTMYYLILTEGEEKLTLNVGLKTYETVSKMTKKQGGTK